MHVLPDAQTVPPVHPFPPHCPYLATVGPAGGAELVVVGVAAAVVGGDDATVVGDDPTTAVLVGDDPQSPTADCPAHTAGPGTV